MCHLLLKMHPGAAAPHDVQPTVQVPSAPAVAVTCVGGCGPAAPVVTVTGAELVELPLRWAVTQMEYVAWGYSFRSKANPRIFVYFARGRGTSPLVSRTLTS